MGSTRRGMLAAMGAAGAGGVTGCLSDGGATTGGDFVAQVSFPVIHDLTANVVPEGSDAENLVPVGQHGHGWNPSPDVQRSVTSSDAFVYVFEGFQPWADDVVSNLSRDHPGIDVVEAGADVELLTSGEGERGRGSTDPHFWLDPLRAKKAVGTVADGLAEADEAGGYTDNADAYASKLDGLHEEFVSALSDAPKDTVLVAGHDAFSYLGERYGFDVVTLTGISPDERPSARGIERAQSLVEEEGIEYVLSPVFESSVAAESIVRDTDADEVLPITAFAGFAQDWLSRDWGYVEVMRNVNLSSLRKALDA